MHFKLMVHDTMEKSERIELEAALAQLLVVPYFDPQDTKPGQTAFMIDSSTYPWGGNPENKIASIVEKNLGGKATFTLGKPF